MTQTATEAKQPQTTMGAFAQALAAIGIAGDYKPLKLLYLILTTRALAQIVSAIIKGPSASGKSFVVKTVLMFFPQEAYVELTAMSSKALVYWKEPLVRRYLVLYEAPGIEDSFVNYSVRSLLTEHQLRYAVSVKENGNWITKYIMREGPTGLITTTTLPSIHAEAETRCLSVNVDDSPALTKEIMLAQAKQAQGAIRSIVNLEPWKEYQRQLGLWQWNVDVPFAEKLAALIDPCAVRLRRDFPTILSLTQAHALLERNERVWQEGRIQATVGDYAAVYELVADIIAEGTGVKESVRQTVDVVKGLRKRDWPSAAGAQQVTDWAAVPEGRISRLDPNDNPWAPPPGVSVTEIAKELRIDKSTASRHVKEALEAGHLWNAQPKLGRGYELFPGEPLPDDVQTLPTPETLAEALGIPPQPCNTATPSLGRANSGGVAELQCCAGIEKFDL